MQAECRDETRAESESRPRPVPAEGNDRRSKEEPTTAAESSREERRLGKPRTAERSDG